MFRKLNRYKKRLKRKQRRKWLTKHHLTPKARGGRNEEANYLLLTWLHHEAWHKLWGLRSIEEVHAILGRIIQAKGRTHHKAYA